MVGYFLAGFRTDHHPTGSRKSAAARRGLMSGGHRRILGNKGPYLLEMPYTDAM
jgi:hypothetical protein